VNQLSKTTTDRDRELGPTLRAGFGIVVSIATGFVFGFAFDNVAIGIAFGLIFGGISGAGLGKVTSAFRRRPDDSDNGAA
jgi:hypothetical protein